MANILYRGSAVPSTTNTAGANNAPLTNDQIDKNFYALNTDKFEKSGGTISGDTTFSTNVTVNGNLTVGSSYKISNTTVLDATTLGSGILNSSLTKLGLSIAGFVKTNASGNLSVDTNTYLTGNQSISISGDATGSGSTSISLTLANSGVTAGTYNNVTVDAKGRVTSGSNVSYLTGNQSISISGDATGSGSTSISLTLANSGVTAGTYNNVTVDAKGRVTSGSNVSSGISISNDTSTASDTFYPSLTSNATSGSITSLVVSSSKLYYNPSAGQLNATNFNSLSDARYKKDLVEIKSALSKVAGLTGYTFTLIESDTRSAGLIAQQIKEVLPEAVGGTDQRLTVSYGALMGLIVEAIKELNAKVENLQNQLANK